MRSLDFSSCDSDRVLILDGEQDPIVGLIGLSIILKAYRHAIWIFAGKMGTI